jgi:hypothetical protein
VRSLSVRQAAHCETAKNKVCRCRCQGQLHGAARELEPTAEFFWGLKPDDPHHVDSQEARKEKRRRARAERLQAEWRQWLEFKRERQPGLFPEEDKP